MHSSLFLAGLALPLMAFAAPTSRYSPRRLSGAALFPRQDNGTCSLDNVQQPANTMQAPTPDLSLVLIAQGRGTQNYTCSSPTATPAAIGAVATLFNASCAVASGSTLGVIEEDQASIGAHFFVDNTTPEFDIIGLGNTQVKKVENATAPNPQDVPWLRLEAPQGTASPVRQIYRLNTVGGVAPKSCEGVAVGETVTVDYEAQYWIYACRERMNALREKRSLGYQK